MKKTINSVIKILTISFFVSFTFSGCKKEGMAADGGYGVFKSGNIAAMTTNNGCNLYDVTNPASASLVSSIDIGYSDGVFIRGNTLFVSTADVLYAYDISDPESPGQLGSIQASIANIFVSDTLMFLKNADEVEIINCKEPGNMSRIGEYKFGSVGNGSGIYAKEDIIYATNGELHQLKFTAAGVITHIRSIPGPAFSFSFDDNYLYVATYLSGAKIVSIADKNNVYTTGSVDFGKTWGITHSSGYMYVASSFSGLTKVDVSNVKSPMVVSKTKDQYAAHGVFYDNGYLYAAGTERGFFILNADDLSVVFD
jgi:hypothetical protein